MQKLLIANRGEIAIRIARTAAELGLRTVAVFAEDDAASLHARACDEAAALTGSGPAAYLDIGQVVAAARSAGCALVHPGYGFLAERADFARAVQAAGLTFVGPAPETLALFGDKLRSRELAEAAGVPVLPGTGVLDHAADALALLERHGAVMLKAAAGGGGRGMRLVRDPAELAAALERCRSEARGGFGDERVYAEALVGVARHIEVQVAGDGREVVALGTRDCSVQRSRQKLVEIAPAPALPDAVREALHAAAVALARAAGLRTLATVEFLVPVDDPGGFVFIEANPRLQVEHTVTEEVYGADLVAAQIALAQGASLAEAGLVGLAPRGAAVQLRVLLESLGADGVARPAAGVVTRHAAPGGPGVRVDGALFTGMAANPRYDPLGAKLIVRSDLGLDAALAKARRALREFAVDGVATNLGLLRRILAKADLACGGVDTRWLDAHLVELAAAEATDPLAVLHAAPAEEKRTRVAAPDGCEVLASPMTGTVVTFAVEAGASVAAGTELVVLDAMKMEHGVAAPFGAVVRGLAVQPGETVAEGEPLLILERAEVAAGAAQAETFDIDHVRPDLAELFARREATLDASRPDAVARRRKTGQRTARENVAALLDEGSFLEIGGLAIAGRSRRASFEELVRTTPADGLVTGVGTVNAAGFGEETARVAVMAYDYTVLAGTQGGRNHQKTDRICELALRWKMPLVLFGEGGGGRPGDTDPVGQIRGFEYFGRLSGKVPTLAVVSGRCFAGNAAFVGACDTIIATRNSNIGMGGPAMIEGGGLGVFAPEQIGPVEVQEASGVIDVMVEDEAEAVQVAKQYVGYFQGRTQGWTCADQRLLRHAVPLDRKRAYDMRALIDVLADGGSVLELRPRFGLAMVTALARVEGRAMGIIANNPGHLGGAIDSDAADKAARLMALCDAHGLPVLSLGDTPGIMVGPEVEKTGLVRHAARLFTVGANLSVPLLSVVVRKSYGLGALAMTGGSYQASVFAVSWPTGEFGPMGLEGAVKLGFRKELEAIADPEERKAAFDRMVADSYERSKALKLASIFEIDDVIDPEETRRWISGMLAKLPERDGERRRWMETW